MTDSPPITVSTKHVPNAHGGSGRFKWLKLYARTITKKAKERRNLDNESSKLETGRGQLGAAPSDSNNFKTVTNRSSKEIASFMTQMPSQNIKEEALALQIQPMPPTVISGSVESEVVRVASPLDLRVSTETCSPIVELSNAFRDTICSDSIPTQQSPKPSYASISPPMSPSFLNPRQAPLPPGPRPDANILVGESDISYTIIAISDSSTPEISATKTSLSDSDSSNYLPSTGSGLERIGAALLGYAEPAQEDYLPDASMSSLEAQAMNDRSLGFLLETMEHCGAFVRTSSKRASERSTTTFSIPSIHSAPENLVESCSSLNDLLRRSSHSFTWSVRVKSGISASLSETLSSVEHILQDQGVTVPSPRNLTELWNALSMGVTREGLAASRAREILHSIIECEFEDANLSVSQSSPSALSESPVDCAPKPMSPSRASLLYGDIGLSASPALSNSIGFVGIAI